jgi:ubiquitin-like-conjugating enzyme ATG10
MKKVMVISGGVEEEGQAGEAKEWEGREVEYLMKWIGVVGGSVGLRVPVEVALAVDRRREA